MSAVGVKYISPLNCSKFVGRHAGQRARRSSISRISLTSCRLFAEQRAAFSAWVSRTAWGSTGSEAAEASGVPEG